MSKIKCPKCGEIFTIDNTDYINIVNQVRSDEFEKSVKEAVKNEVEKNNILKEKEYSELKLSYDKNFAELNLVKEKEISEIKTKYDEIIRNKDLAIKDAEDELERVKDHKLSLSTKAVGEDLEQYCKAEFEKLRPVAYRNAYFQKDNQTEDHTKGDFIFRDYDNTIEYISIMFEMKNESDFTKTKQKNEEFFKKLDSDRKKKKCEYAVLVSMLEQDNDFYNKGIVEICQYEKMYVVRPQYFMDIISLLRNMARSSLDVKKALIEKEKADVDFTNFNRAVNEIVERSGVHYNNALNQHDKAIKEINNAIKKLEAARDALDLSNRHMEKFSNKIIDLKDTKKLTVNAPSLVDKINKIEKEV